MLNLKIDSENKSFYLEMMLKGESDVIKFEIGEYKIVEDGNRTFLQFKQLKTNREWVNILIENYLKINQIEIPQQYKRLLTIAL
jgi:hypothetical protein